MRGDLIAIDVHGVTVPVLSGSRPEAALVAMKPLVECMGLDWSAQFRRIRRHHVLGAELKPVEIHMPGDQLRVHVFLPLARIDDWLQIITVIPP
jgi:DNA mismatch repair protein MutH